MTRFTVLNNNLQIQLNRLEVTGAYADLSCGQITAGLSQEFLAAAESAGKSGMVEERHPRPKNFRCIVDFARKQRAAAKLASRIDFPAG